MPMLTDDGDEVEEDRQLIDIQAYRRNSNIELYVTLCDEIEELIASSCERQYVSMDTRDGEIQLYRVYTEQAEKLNSIMARYTTTGITNTTQNKLKTVGDVDVHPLFAVGASEGVRITYKNEYSEEDLQQILHTIREAATILYKQFIKPVRVRATAVFETVS